ncbi:MAG TPA: trimethylamine methyltransferase family protein [Thermoleophilia bacterium]|nr:trimethylamine methyltransferase family protein [Thermoleophilia bacterium]
MKARNAWLEEPEKSRIVDAALEILSTTGMRFTGSQVLPLLRERGADLDEAAGVVRLPRELVEWAIEQTPRSFVMAGASPEHDVVLGSGQPFRFCPSGCVAKTLDFRSGSRRPSTLQDLRECTAVMDELPQLDLMWTQVSATDVPLERRELTEYFTAVTETTKHVTFVDCPREVDTVLRMCEVLSDGLDRFRDRPRISTVCTAASPLQVDGPALDMHAALARHGVPIEVYSMAIAGATSPVTLAGTVVQGLAEFLGVATALQVAAPNARLVFCFGSGVLDMLQTTFSLGSVESALMGVMATEVGHHVGVPTLVPGLSTDGKAAGLQTGYEKALKALTVCGAGPDIVTGWGLIDSHNTMYLPQSVVDNEIAGMIRRLSAAVETSDAALATAIIGEVGPGGGFLGVKDTARRIRAGEHYRPTVSGRLSYEKWAEQGLTENDTAEAIVEQALVAHREKGPILSEDQIEELGRLCGVGPEAVGHAARR